MSILINIFLALEVVVALLIIFLVLMQRPKNEGLGAAFGGGMTDNIFGAQTTNVLASITRWLGGIFFGLSLLLSWMYAHQTTKKSALGERLSTGPTAISATPGATPVPGTTPAATPLPAPDAAAKTPEVPAPAEGTPAAPAAETPAAPAAETPAAPATGETPTAPAPAASSAPVQPVPAAPTETVPAPEAAPAAPAPAPEAAPAAEAAPAPAPEAAPAPAPAGQ